MAFTGVAFAATAPKVQVQPQTRIVNKVDNRKLTTLAHTAPAIASTAVDKGHLAPTTQLNHMLLVLKGTDEQDYALRSLLDEQQDKSSPNFHKWMTPETFGATFGVSSTDLAKVSAWLQDSGFSVEQISKGARTIQFSGTAGQVETAFHTELHNVTVNGEAHFVNTTDLSVPEALSPVMVGISKLNDFGYKTSAVNPRPLVKGTDGQFYPVVPGTNQPDYTSLSSANHYISPADVAIIYNANPLLSGGINGTGQTIGVIGQSTINLTNVETFRSMFKLPNNDPQIINVGPPPAITGTVTFKDGATTIGTATVTNGVATLTTATLIGVGTHTVTATYSGDSNYYTSTSTNLVSIVAVTPGFSITLNPASLVIKRGASGSVTVTATSVGNYNGAVSLSCLGLPNGSYCSFSPAGGVAFAGVNTSTNVTLTITTLAPSAHATAVSSFLWLPAMMLGGLLTLRRKQLTVRGRQLMMLALLACGVMAVSGCGSGGGFAGTPTGTSNITIQATGVGSGQGSGNVSPAATLTLTVQ